MQMLKGQNFWRKAKGGGQNFPQKGRGESYLFINVALHEEVWNIWPPLSEWIWNPGDHIYDVFTNSQKRVPFSDGGSDLSRSEKRVCFWADLGNKGTFSMTLFIVWSNLLFFSRSVLAAMVINKYSSCHSEIRVLFYCLSFCHTIHKS